MKILLDLGHPKYVHALKNSIRELRQKGHEILALARNKECVLRLCSAYDIPFVDRGKGGKGVIDRAAYWVRAVARARKLIDGFRPDLLASFGSPILAVAGALKRLPIVVFDDHEPNRLVQAVYIPSSAAIVVPACFRKELSRKQRRFNGYFELAYLHPDRFTPDPHVRGDLGLERDQPYVLLRFVSWNAFHDRGRRGIALEWKRKLVEAIAAKARVFISSEGVLPEDLAAMRFPLPPERIHDAMAGAALVVGDSTTMAAEAAVLGVPSLHMSDIKTGYLLELQDKFMLLESFAPDENGLVRLLKRASDLVLDAAARSQWQKRRECMLADKIDVAGFISWFLENFPGSFEENSQ